MKRNVNFSHQYPIPFVNKRTHVVLSEQLVKDIDTVVGSRQRSRFLTQAAERELMRLRQLKALEEAVPWKDQKPP